MNSSGKVPSIELFQRALALQRTGRLTEAEQIYDELSQPASTCRFEALHMLGVIKAQQGRHVEALALLDKALQIGDQSASAMSNYGNVLTALGRSLEALEYYERAIAIDPNQAGAWKGRGDSLLRAGRVEDALLSYTRSLERRGNNPDALNGRGNALRIQGRFGEALADYERAIALDPCFAEALLNRGFALFNLGQDQQAIRAFDQALALRPSDIAALNHKGMALRRLRQDSSALKCHDAALAIDPANPDTCNNRAFTLHRMGRLEEAHKSYNQALVLRPGDPELLTNRGTVLRDMGRHQEALANFDRAIGQNPAHANAFWNKAVSKLLLGEFDEGWDLYEWRKRLPSLVEARSYPSPALTGADDVSGKDVFVYAGQGLGDTIQFWRFVRILKERGANVAVSVQDSLVRLLKHSDPEIMVAGADFMPAHFDYHVALASLPLTLGRGGDVLPRPEPYIRAEDALAAYWRDRIGRHGFKIGIAWQGALGFDNGRAIPAKQFASLADISGVRMISLQKEADPGDLAAIPRVERLGDSFDSGCDAFLDTAAVMLNLDLVITLDSAIAHIAGALGRPVWIALRAVPDWRWQLSRTDSPWYPTARLFRQQVAGDWQTPFSKIATALTRIAPGG